MEVHGKRCVVSFLSDEIAMHPTVGRFDCQERVADEAAPRGKILFDTDFPAPNLEHAAGRQRLQRVPDDQEQTAAAVQIAAITHRVR